MVEELQAIHRVLPKLLTNVESKSIFVDLVEKLESKLNVLIGSTDISQPSLKEHEKTISPPPSDKDFNRYESVIDKWGVIESIESIMSSYSNLSHLAFPMFYFSACKEIHRYTVTREIEIGDTQEIIQIPALKLKDVVKVEGCRS
jgi:hypothetical protein